MPKTGRSDNYWHDLCDKLAAGGAKPTVPGWHPKGGKWKTQVENILACPETIRRQNSRGRSRQSLLSFAGQNSTGILQCTCKWDHDSVNNAPPADAAAAAAAQPPSRPQKEVNFGILRKPNPRKTVGEVRGIYRIYQQKGCFNLEVFGYDNGKCPHCKSSNIVASNINKSVKLIYTMGKPRFVQGIGLTCRDCGGAGGSSGWQSFEKTYVDTLSKKQQNELHAVVAGKRNGVDTDVIMRMRLGATASAIARENLANLTKLHAQWEDEYEENCRIATEMGYDVVEQVFPTLEESDLLAYCAKSEIVIISFIRDTVTVKDELLREMASLRSQKSMAIDHQRKVVKHAAGNDGASSFTVAGDGGIVLGYYVVPNDGERWVKHAMLEIVHRHGAVLNDDLKTVKVQGNLPPVIYVDKMCCGGTEGSRSDAVRYFYGMLKKLDAFHLIQRIGKEINCEHPRKGAFLKSLSECIFTQVQEDVAALQAARDGGDYGVLSEKKQKKDNMLYVRTKIENPERIVSKILVLVKGQISIDRQAKKQSIEAGDKCEDINTAHRAYPLITKKILKCGMQQCFHILNGCVHDECDMNVLTGQSFYRDTQTLLDTYTSQRGSNRVEAWHSVADRKLYALSVMRQSFWNARMLWNAINYNRERLRKLGKENVLPDGVAPSEASKRFRAAFVQSTSLLFGFDYLNYIQTTEIQEEVQDKVLAAIDNSDVIAAIDNADDEELAELSEIFEDDSATDEECVYDISEGDDDSIFEPLKTSDIPDTVDSNELETLAVTLGEDVAWTATENPFAEVQPIQEGELQEALDEYPTFKELVQQADVVAAQAGIDVDMHDFASVTHETFEASNKVSSRRNVLARTQRSSVGKYAPPDFNDRMEKKFHDIWFDKNKNNPFQGANMRE